jgi:site-specific DNA recombinase
VTFEQVRVLLAGNRVRRTMAADAEHPSLLAGILWDSDGRRMSPSHANKNGARYRYYISRKDKERLSLAVHRVPAGGIETLVAHQLRQHTDASWDTPSPTRDVILDYIEQVTVHPDCLTIRFAGIDEPVTVTASLIRCSGETRIATATDDWPNARRDPSLIKLIVRAHQARKALDNPGNRSLETAASSMGLSVQYLCRLLRLAYLAPDITAAILDGRQPAHLNRQFLARINSLPIDWAGQREMLGFA